MKKPHLMYDLHGLSEAQAEALVERAIRETHSSDTSYLRFITGRGNHLNSKGQRGTLFSNFPNWVQSSSFADKIDRVVALDGHYEVFVKPTLIMPKDQAEQALDNLLKENKEAIQHFAKLGDLHSMCLMAQLLEEGKYVEQDRKAASEYYLKAAEAGYPIAMQELARFYLFGIGVKQSDSKAQEWLWKAHHAGVIQATVTLARSYAYACPGYPHDVKQAIELHQIAADAGATDSMRFFGSIYLSGIEVEKSHEKSFEWYKKAADLGDAKAQFNIATYYHKGIGTPVDITASKKYFALSAQNGDPDAQYIHAMNCLENKDKTSREQGIMWLFTASDNGSEQASRYLSKLLKSDASDPDFLQRSADAGNFFSQLELDRLNGQARRPEDIPIQELTDKFEFLSENEIKLLSERAKFFLLDRILLEAKAKYQRKAFGLLSDMAEDHLDPQSLRRLAAYYLSGNGLFAIKKNIPKALELLTIAANNNDAIAQLTLGLHYKHQVHNPQNIALAKKWLRRSAELKYPPAFYYLGELYEQGHFGVNKQDAAITCYRSAIKYAQVAGHLEKFILSPMDHYTDKTCDAKVALNRLTICTQTTMVTTPSSQTQYSGLRAGFFHAASVTESDTSPVLTANTMTTMPPARNEPTRQHNALPPIAQNTSSFFNITSALKNVGSSISSFLERFRN